MEDVAQLLRRMAQFGLSLTEIIALAPGLSNVQSILVGVWRNWPK